MVKYRYEFAMNLKRKFLLLILMMRCNIAQHIWSYENSAETKRIRLKV